MVYLDVLKITRITIVFTGIFKVSSYNRQKKLAKNIHHLFGGFFSHLICIVNVIIYDRIYSIA